MSNSPTPERRRDPRQDKNVSLKLKWDDSEGNKHEETIQTESINTYGCMFFLKSRIVNGTEIELMNPATNRTSEAKVIWCGDTDAEGRTHVGVELVEPDAEFWALKIKEKAGEEKIEKDYSGRWAD